MHARRDERLVALVVLREGLIGDGDAYCVEPVTKRGRPDSGV
jgi:hypothetical protein